MLLAFLLLLIVVCSSKKRVVHKNKGFLELVFRVGRLIQKTTDIIYELYTQFLEQTDGEF